MDIKELEVHLTKTSKEEKLPQWASGFYLFGKEIAVKACYGAIKLILPVWKNHPEIEVFDSSPVLRGFEIIESWIQNPNSQNVKLAKAHSPVMWKIVEQAIFVFDEYSGDAEIVRQREIALNALEAIAYTVDAVAWTEEDARASTNELIEAEARAKNGPAFETVQVMVNAKFALNDEQFLRQTIRKELIR